VKNMQKRQKEIKSELEKYEKEHIKDKQTQNMLVKQENNE